MAENQPPGALIRVGHSERDAVAALLQEAAGDGRLTMAELDERLEIALQATTYADLDPLVADLSPELPWHTSRPHHSPAQGPPPPGYSRQDPLRLDGGMSSDKRSGAWTVPPFIRINQGLGSVRLDCLEATPDGPLIEIEMIGGAGSTVIIVPDGWGVNADRLSKSWGTKTVKVPREPAAGLPLLVIHGQLGLGSFTVRPPSRRQRRRSSGARQVAPR